MIAGTTKTGWELVEDLALGLSCWGWAVLGILNDAGPPLLARIGASAINLFVGLSFLFRERVPTRATTRAVLRALPSLMVGGIAWRLSGTHWPPSLEVAFLVVALCACATMLVLGRSFAIFPVQRSLRTWGPYALIRHPLYLLELGLVGIAASAHSGWTALALVLVGAALIIPRIHDEERLLACDPTFAAYAARVKFRLVPGLW